MCVRARVLCVVCVCVCIESIRTLGIAHAQGGGTGRRGDDAVPDPERGHVRVRRRQLRRGEVGQRLRHLDAAGGHQDKSLALYH